MPHSAFKPHSNVEEKKRVPKPSDAQKSESESDSEGRRTPQEENMTDSLIRQNFSPECEDLLNKQINLELQAWYTYVSMWIYFERHDVALPGFAKFFMVKSKEEKKHAIKLMKYLIKRGGRLVLQDIPKPAADSWGTGLEAMKTALDMLKSLNESLLQLHKLSVKRVDPHMEKFVKKYLDEHVEIIKIHGNHVTNLERVGTKGLGVYMFDKKTLKSEAVTKVAKRTKVIKVIKIAKRHGNKSDSDSSDCSDSDSD